MQNRYMRQSCGKHDYIPVTTLSVVVVQEKLGAYHLWLQLWLHREVCGHLTTLKSKKSNIKKQQYCNYNSILSYKCVPMKVNLPSMSMSISSGT